MKVIWRKAALRDLDGIWRHIASDNQLAATRNEQRIRERVNSLADFPHAAPKNECGPGFRLVISRTRYIVIYRVESGNIYVDAVFHGARDR